MKKLFGFLLIALSLPCLGQITTQANTGMAAPVLSGNGIPSALFTCNLTQANLTYIQLDATNGKIWLCDFASGNWAWDHMTAPISGATVSIGGALLIANGTTSGTATVTGAVAGQNCIATRSDGALPPAGVIIDCAVTSANTITVRLTALISATPSATTYNVRVFQ